MPIVLYRTTNFLRRLLYAIEGNILTKKKNKKKKNEKD